MQEYSLLHPPSLLHYPAICRSDVRKTLTWTGLSVVDLQRLFKPDAPRDAVFKVLNALHNLGDKSPYIIRLSTRRVVEVGRGAKSS